MKADTEKRQRCHIRLAPEVVAYVKQFQAMSKAPSFSRAAEQLIMQALHNEAYIEQVDEMADAVERGVAHGMNRMAKLIAYGCIQAGETKHAITNLFELALLDEFDDLTNEWKQERLIDADDLEAYLELAKGTPERETAAQFMRKRSGRWRYRSVHELKKTLPDELEDLAESFLRKSKTDE